MINLVLRANMGTGCRIFFRITGSDSEVVLPDAARSKVPSRLYVGSVVSGIKAFQNNEFGIST